MSKQLVECIPNFSEARRPEVVEKIAAAILAVPGVQILDRHSDTDHNRTVLTLLGEPQAVEQGVFEGIREAAALIDMDVHQGEHPRIGATDVVPFVPIREMDMRECVEIARRLASRVADELNIPVYLYEEAATRPDRVNLEDIRRGQYEGLKEEICTNPERKPDFGPSAMGKAGATVIGARYPLIAFNVYLTTDDVSIAKKIARQVRHSSGGFRFVKAMGVLVEGRAQVSMNLTNFQKTPIAQVVEFVRREAARYGVAVHHSELVGLIPQKALTDAAVWYLQLDQYDDHQILENKLMAPSSEPVSHESSEENTFLDALASSSPTPGGGSAAAWTCAEAAALVTMVARLTVGKSKYKTVEPQMWALIEQAEQLRKQLQNAVREDAAAFETVMNAFKLPKDSEEQMEVRRIAIQQATLDAATVPLETAKKALEVMHLAENAVASGNLNAITDAATAAHLAAAGLTAAAANVSINIASLEDEKTCSNFQSELESLKLEKEAILTRVAKHVTERSQITLI
ncbi:MAG TPA: glutamate formimidoyltransferase [Anaerolineaceae bacterium]|nr:glutamate formimidoyltransferase [Anaerolineaceae bacterium]